MNNTIEVAKSFKKFFMFIIICVVLGNILSHRAQKILDEKWSQFSRSFTAKKIEVSRPTVLFARSGMPAIGASIDSLSHSGTSRCFEYQIKAEQLFLPLSLTKLLLGRLEFGTLQVESTTLQVQESPECIEDVSGKTASSSTLKDEFEDVISSATTQKKSPEIFEHLKKWFTTHQPRLSSMPLRHFFLKKIEIQGETLKEKRVQGLGSLSVDLDEELVAELSFEKLVLGKTTRSVATQFQAEVRANAERILLAGDWAYYEGHLLVDLNYNKNEEVYLNLKSQNLPLSVVNRWFDTPWTFQFMWFNCGLNLKTKIEQWQESPWMLEPCQITGPHGEIEFQSKKMPNQLASLSHFNDLSIEVKELQLDRIFKGKEHLPLSGVIKDYGSVNGQFSVKEARVDGRLLFKEPSLLFSRQNKRLLQVLDELQLGVRYENSYYTFSLSDVKIRGGEFRGFTEAAYYKKQQKVALQIRIPQILFSPEIQNLMFSGVTSALSIDGDVQWIMDAEPAASGKVQVGFESYKNSYVNVSKGTALFGWSSSEPQIALTADQVKIDRSDSTQWLFASVMEDEPRQHIRLQQVYINGLLLPKNKLDLKKSTAYAPTLGRLSLTGQLDWREGQGQARWQLVNGRNMEWEWSYRPQDSTWIPQNKQMRDWLLQHNDYLTEYPFVR